MMPSYRDAEAAFAEFSFCRYVILSALFSPLRAIVSHAPCCIFCLPVYFRFTFR